ncbi:hypothetical protein [Methanobrevibacter gottschalkii]|uniref:hypothetical protein n=1 Tax=Methanobrevibacter gottschalkii TaxID=190974 RepID=UPI0038D1F47D
MTINTIVVTNEQDSKEVQLVAQVNAHVAKAEAALAKLNEYLQQREALAKFANIGAGDQVSFPYGRGENRRELTGQVLARNEDKIKVLVGSGFDTEVLVVLVGSVTDVVVAGATSVEDDPREEAEAEERTESAAAQAEAANALADELLAGVQIG